MEIKEISITEIKPYENNAKEHPAEQVKQIANSIKEFGWQQPIVIDKNSEIVIGHGRYAAALSLGLEKVPCVRAEELTEEQINALRIIDNKTNESIWDIDILQGEIEELPECDFGEFGFSDYEIGAVKQVNLATEKSTKEKRKRIIIIMRNEEEQEKIKSLFGITDDLKPQYSAEDLMEREAEYESDK